MASSFTCSICCEDFKQNISPVCCTGEECNLQICHLCFKTDILTRESSDCPGCKTPYSLPLVRQATTKTFYMNEYAMIRAKDYMERERSMMRATRATVQIEQTQAEIDVLFKKHRTTMSTLEEVLGNYRKARSQMEISLEGNHKTRKKMISDLKEAMKRVRALMAKEEQCYEQVHIILYRKIVALEQIATPQKKTEEEVDEAEDQVRLPCTKPDCVGELVKWKCTVCETYVCAKCQEPKKSRKDETHQCKPEVLESLKDIKSTTRPCPKCRVPIFKTMGCRQMWCVVCHTAFDFYTGKIETGIIHNPHYVQFRREMGAGAPNINAGCNCNEIDPVALRKEFRERCPTDPTPNPYELARLITECSAAAQGIVLPYNEQTNVGIRKKFARGVITETQFEKALLRSMLKREMQMELAMIYECLADSLISWVDEFTSIKDHTQFTSTFGSIIHYAYRNIKNIETYYGVPHSSYSWINERISCFLTPKLSINWDIPKS